MSSIPVSLRNKIKEEVTNCVVKDGKDVKSCIIRSARMHGLSVDQAEEIPLLMDVEDE